MFFKYYKPSKISSCKKVLYQPPVSKLKLLVMLVFCKFVHVFLIVIKKLTNAIYNESN
jgi:hypothetical protein